MTDRSGVGREAPWLVKAVLLLGLCLIIGAAALAVGKEHFLAGSRRAAGTVTAVSNEIMRDYNGRMMGGGYRISVSFVDEQGQTNAVRSPVTTSATSWRVGDAVDVNYPAGHPEKAVIATFGDRWLAPIIVGSIGFVAALIGGLGLWMARQPGTRFYGDGRTSFGMAIGNASSPPPSPPLSTDKVRTQADGTRKSGNLPVIVAALVAAAGVGLLTARVTSSRSNANMATDAMTNSTAPEATSSTPTITPGGNYPPANLTVEAPPTMKLPATPPSQADGGNGPALTQMARAFLARPEQDAAIQAALRAKAAKLPDLCASLSFVPGDTLVAGMPPPMFDAEGKMRRGLIRQRFTGVGCPNASPRFNLWIFAEDPQRPVKTVAGYMGATRADPPLQRDATPIAIGIASRLVPGCTDMSVLDTRLPAGSGPAVAGQPWTEEWLLAGCGRYVQVTMHFIPAPAGTRIEVPSTEAKIIR